MIFEGLVTLEIIITKITSSKFTYYKSSNVHEYLTFAFFMNDSLSFAKVTSVKIN